MSRAAPTLFPWPRVEPAAKASLAEPSEAGPLALLSPAALAAALAPELGRLFALEVLPADRPAAPARPVLVARLPVTGGDGEPARLIALAVDAATAGSAIARLYGAPGSVADGEPDLPAGLAGSASWLAFARLLAMALARSLAGLGVAPAGAPDVKSRPLPAEPLPGAMVLALELGSTRLGLMLAAEAPAPRTASPAPAADGGFAARARARVLDVALPVTLRLAGWRLPLGRVATLKAGDVLPIEPPRHLDLMVGGERLARLPADRLLDRPASPPEDA
jgi:hypothetical protein